jgi:hypothetical protein
MHFMTLTLHLFAITSLLPPALAKYGSGWFDPAYSAGWFDPVYAAKLAKGDMDYEPTYFEAHPEYAASIASPYDSSARTYQYKLRNGTMGRLINPDFEWKGDGNHGIIVLPVADPPSNYGLFDDLW